jgi:heme/copper-type cytochrome/quinol oxidase subunit 2
MSHEERNVVTEILANAVIIGLFLWFLVAGHAAGRFDGPDGVQVWAVLVLKLIGLSIVTGIVLAILMAIVWRVVTGEKPDLTRDERDRAISGIGWKVQGIATAIGVVGAVGALALGYPVITAMNLILAGCAFGDTGGNLAKLRAYRRGL